MLVNAASVDDPSHADIYTNEPEDEYRGGEEALLESVLANIAFISIAFADQEAEMRGVLLLYRLLIWNFAVARTSLLFPIMLDRQ